MVLLKCNHLINTRNQHLWVCLSKVYYQITTAGAPSSTLEKVMGKEVTHFPILLQIVPLFTTDEVGDPCSKGREVHSLSGSRSNKEIIKRTLCC